MHPDYKYSVGGQEGTGNVFGGSQGTQATSAGVTGHKNSSGMVHSINAHGVKVTGMPNPNTQIGFFQ